MTGVVITGGLKALTFTTTVDVADGTPIELTQTSEYFVIIFGDCIDEPVTGR